MVDSNDNNLCLWNFPMKLLHLLGLNAVFVARQLVTKLNLYFGYFLDGSRFEKSSRNSLSLF